MGEGKPDQISEFQFSLLRPPLYTTHARGGGAYCLAEAVAEDSRSHSNFLELCFQIILSSLVLRALIKMYN